jgi:dolichol-phosphate mannosyltransferase
MRPPQRKTRKAYVNPKIMVVIPTYNEAENLPLIAGELLALPLENLHILVVDDNSPDGTGKIADDLVVQHSGRVNVLHRQKKEGLGPAYIHGFKHALSLGAEIVVQMDADFSHQPKYVVDLVEKLDMDYDFVVASRFSLGGSVDETWSPYRKLLSWFANRVYVRLLLGIPVSDATGGFRIWRRETLIGMDLDRIMSSGYVFQVEMAYVACRQGFRVTEIPIYFPDRTRGKSKMDASIPAEAALRVLQVMKWHRGLNPNQRRTEPYTLPDEKVQSV